MHKSKVELIGLLTLFVGALLMQSCALGDRKIALTYEPVVHLQSGENEKVAVVKFKDARQVQDYGEVRNGYGIKMASVVAEGQDVGAWVANGLAEELSGAGLSVEKFGDIAPPNITFAVQGTVLEAYVKMYMSYRTTVRAQVTMEKNGICVLNKEYKGSAGGLAMLASSNSYETQLQQALQALMKQLVPDVLAGMRQ